MYVVPVVAPLLVKEAHVVAPQLVKEESVVAPQLTMEVSVVAPSFMMEVPVVIPLLLTMEVSVVEVPVKAPQGTGRCSDMERIAPWVSGMLKKTMPAMLCSVAAPLAARGLPSIVALGAWKSMLGLQLKAAQAGVDAGVHEPSGSGAQVEPQLLQALEQHTVAGAAASGAADPGEAAACEAAQPRLQVKDRPVGGSCRPSAEEALRSQDAE